VKPARKPKVYPDPVDFSKIDYDTKNLPVIEITFSPVLTRPLYYPKNLFAKALCFMLQRLTFTKAEVDHLRNMGFVVDVSLREVEIPEEYK